MNTVVISSERPAYKILSEKGFFGPDDHLYTSGEMIYFDDEPNEDMEPLNDLARVKIRDLIEKLDRLGREAAEKFDRPYTSRASSLEEAIQLSTEDARRVQSIGNPNGVALMKSDKRGKTTGIERVASDEIPETKGNKTGKLSIKKPVG